MKDTKIHDMYRRTMKDFSKRLAWQPTLLYLLSNFISIRHVLVASINVHSHDIITYDIGLGGTSS